MIGGPRTAMTVRWIDVLCEVVWSRGVARVGCAFPFVDGSRGGRIAGVRYGAVRCVVGLAQKLFRDEMRDEFGNV